MAMGLPQMTGTEMLLSQVFKLLGLDGEKVKLQVASMGEFVVAVRGDLDAIKKQQAEIIALQKQLLRSMGINLKEIDDGPVRVNETTAGTKHESAGPGPS